MIDRSYKKRVKSKQYRAVVIDFRTVVKFLGVIAVVSVLSVFLGIGIKTIISDKQITAAEDTHKTESVAKTEDSDEKDEESFIKKALKLVIGYDIWDKTNVVAVEVPGAEIVNGYDIVKKADINEDLGNKEDDIKQSETKEAQETEEGDLIIKAINAGQNANSDTNEIKIGNHTSYSVDIDGMRKEPLSFNMNEEGPKVLIIHTHATESYSPEGAKRYSSGDSERSLDTSQNVVAIGDMVEKIFSERGIETLHDRGLHDHPSFNGAYQDALNSIEDYLNKYPSIEIVLDLHRDSIVYDDGTKAKLITKIEDKDAAQLMFVVGTDEKGLYNPLWRENLKFAIKLQDAIDKKYPNLMRRIDLRQERFNAHATKGSLIIEMGSSGNSLSEAKYGMERAAIVIADFLNGLK